MAQTSRRIGQEGAFDNSVINKDQDDEMVVYGYRRHRMFTIISWFFTVVTLGAVQLVFHWWPHIMLYTTHYRCHIRFAEKLLLEEHPNKTFIAVYHVETVNMSPSMRMFEFKKQRYIWNEKREGFYKLNNFDSNVSSAWLHENLGLSSSQQEKRQLLYGKNETDVPMQSITELLFLEVLNPFYIFQLFSVGLWFAYEYLSYAVAILIMSAISIIMTVIQTRENQRRLYNTICSSDVVSIVRTRNKHETTVCTVDTDQLVPGDLILIPAHGCVMHCDAVLLSGSCVVNESVLTGESVPVTKTPLPNSPSTVFSYREHDKHTLFCGTHVIKTRYQSNKDIYAVVIRTGFNTAKGELVRSILYPTPITFKFEQDSYKFMQLMAGLASVGFIYTVVTKLNRGVPATTIALEALDLVTVVVPPSLPTAMAVGCMSALTRLRRNNIFCVSPRTINVSGSIDCVCFDKTGTLTEDGLDMWGVVPFNGGSFGPAAKDASALGSGHLLHAMASCHSLSVIDSKICGDPLEMKMIEWTDWVLEEPQVEESSLSYIHSAHMMVARPSDNFVGKVSKEIEIIHQFPFSSSLQRMSVITRQIKKDKDWKDRYSYTVYCKGSPEIIRNLCNPHSIPKDFEKRLEQYTEKGYRVLGIAYKSIDLYADQLPREEIEKDLDFLGLIVFENRLKPVTKEVISALQSANIRSIMVTGDNQLTALSVARECGIITPTQRVCIVGASPPSHKKPARLQYKMCQGSNMPHVKTQISFDSVNKSKHVTKDKDIKNTRKRSEENKNFSLSDIFSATDISLTLTGDNWEFIRLYFPDEIPAIVRKCAVFSRMSPDQKQQLVLCLQSLGYYVGMCGDGANDCGALKAAHAGISLSQAESSVASPFLSKDSTIDCVVKVIQEGRAALVTSFAIFKYMAGFSLTQFVSVMLLYSTDSNLTDVQYLFVDLFLISVFAFLLGRTQANSGPLTPRSPEISLMSPIPLASLIGQVVIVVIIQFISFLSLSQYDWFEPYDPTKSSLKGPGCFENYALFSVSSMQYVTLAVVFCKGAPYRLPLAKNWSLWLSVSCVTAFIFYLILGPDKWFQDQFELVMPPEMDFRIFCIFLCVVNFVVAVVYEFYICDKLILNKIRYSNNFRGKKEKIE